MNFIKIMQLIIALIVIMAWKIGSANQFSEFNGSVNLANVQLDKVQVNGSADFKSSKFQSLTVNGELNFKDLIISEMIEINGATNGKNIECKDLIVSGTLEGYNIKVTRDAIVNGYLSVHDSSFEELKINAKKMIFNNSTTKNIIIEPFKNKIKQQLILQGKTTVNGDIIFRSELGEVLLGRQAKITGKVIGGKISFK